LPEFRATLGREDLFVPDRFEGLRGTGADSLRAIVHPVEATLSALDERFREIRASRRGALMILRGDTGAGKSTFLDTVGLFRGDVSTERVPGTEDVGTMLETIGRSDGPRVIVLAGREALRAEKAEAIEASLHAVNTFVRSDSGAHTLVVWPTNTDALTKLLVEVADTLGGTALLGSRDSVEAFAGPPREAFMQIAECTVQALNSGASLSAMGISEDGATEMAAQAATIGQYLGLVRDALIANGAAIKELLEVERYRLWTLVIAGNDPENDVAAVTRGSHGYADIDRLLSATDANVVKDLKRYPQQLGLLATNLDARILHMETLTALAVAREFGDDQLHGLMKQAGMVTAQTRGTSAAARLAASELGLLLAADALGTRKRGSRPGGSSQAAFASLAAVARTNDGALNRAIGKGLTQSGLVDSYETEHDLGTELRFASDLYMLRAGEPIRVEVMWRSNTGRAAIANYVLTKLWNYGRAIGYLR
jgi:hypothetical protein